MPLYPLFLDLRGLPITVAGAGPIAARRVAALVEAGALVTVVAPDIAPALLALAAQKRLRLLRRRWNPADSAKARLVFACTGVPATDRRIAANARRRGVWCNVAGEAAAGSFHVPAVLRRDPVQIAVSTGGCSPAFAKRLRERIARAVGTDAGKTARSLGADRARSLARKRRAD